MRALLSIIVSCLILISANGIAADPESCMECHRLELVSMRNTSVPRLLHLDEVSFEHSKHGGLYCSDCHADAVQTPHMATPEIISCIDRCHVKGGGVEQQKIHMEKYYAYQEDVHFSQKIDCEECHNEFSSMNRLNASLMCVRCHRGGAPGERNMIFSTPLHGDLIGPDARVLCVDCHTPHAHLAGEESATKAPANCYRGMECHGSGIGKKAYLGGHVRKKETGFLSIAIQGIFQMICALFVALGALVVYKRKEGEIEGKDRH